MRASEPSNPQRSRDRAGTAWLRATTCLLWLSALACGESAEPDRDAAPGRPAHPGFEAGAEPISSADAGSGSGNNLEAGASSAGDAGSGRADASTPTASDARAEAGLGVADASGDASNSGGEACTRESLKAAVESYYSALSARDPSKLKVSAQLKVTENAKLIQLGEGLWKSAGMVRFKRSALDVEQCETVSESVVDNNGQDFILGLRLKLEAGAIREVESILVGPDGWFPNPKNIISSASEDWETPLPEAERTTREAIKKDIVDGYFVGVFGGKIKVADYPFASSCKRAENGFSPGACNFGVPTSMPMTPLHYVVDLEAGIGVGFVLFGSSSRGMLDFHMFKVKSKQVHGVRAVVGPSVSARNWP